MTHPASPYFRRSVAGLVLIAALFPVVYWGAVEGVRHMFTSPSRWLPEGTPQRDRHERFVKLFDVQDVLIVSWPGCTIDDDRLARVARELRQQERPAADGRPLAELFVRVRTGYDVVRDLEQPPLSLSRDEAVDRLVGTLVGYDRRTSCAVVDLTPRATIKRRLAIDSLLDIVEREAGVDRDACYLGGNPVHGLAIDEQSISTFDNFSLVYMAVACVVCWLCLRSIPLTFAVMVVGGFGERLAVSTVFFSGTTMSAVLIVLSPLVFVLTVSAGVHLANYYRDEAKLHDPTTAVRRALAVGWFPCWLAALTTTIGLLSLTASDILPIRQFGILASVSLFGSVLLLFVVLPGIAERWGAPRSAVAQATSPNRWDQMWLFWGRFLWQRRTAVVVVLLSLAVFAGSGVQWLKTNIDVLELLPPDDPAVRDSRWFEQHLAALVPVEVLVHVALEDTSDVVDRLLLLERIEEAVRRHPSVHGTISALTFLPKLPSEGGLRQTVRRSVFRRRVESRLPRLVQGGFLRATDAEQTWRITARTPAFGHNDYGEILASLEAEVASIVDRYTAGHPAARYTLTGVMPVVHDAQRLLMRSLIVSYSMAFGLVTIVLMFALMSIRSALVAMIPNLLPTGVLLGCMGWLARPVDIGSMMAASIGLGIAVDDTLHYMLWFRREVSVGARPAVAMVRALRRCGSAMLQTTVIITLGMLVFLLSPFAPTRRFSMTISLLLVAAIVGDLVLLPALLVGPFSGIFHRKRGQPVRRWWAPEEPPSTDVTADSLATTSDDNHLAEPQSPPADVPVK